MTEECEHVPVRMLDENGKNEIYLCQNCACEMTEEDWNNHFYDNGSAWMRVRVEETRQDDVDFV